MGRDRSATGEAPKESDHELMARVKAGDEAAYAALYERHKASVLSHADRMLRDAAAAEDVLQDAFLYVFRMAPNYRPDARFTTLLYRCVRSICLDRLARVERKRRKDLPEGLADPSQPAPPELAAAREDKRRLEKAVAELPENFREALSLRLGGGLSNGEIADILGVPVGTVKSRLHYALEKLRETLGGPA